MLKKHSVTKNCSDLSLFEQIVLVVSKILQILSNFNCFNLLYMRNLQEQAKKAFCYQKFV